MERVVALDVVRLQRATVLSHSGMSRRVGFRRSGFVLHPHFVPYRVKLLAFFIGVYGAAMTFELRFRPKWDTLMF